MKDFLQNLGVDDEIIKDSRRISPLVLAYVGDAVYEWYIRGYLVAKKRGKVYDFHKSAIKYVKASGQAYALKQIQDMLSDDEKAIVRRARNQKPNSVPKYATLVDYTHATALEALLGHYMIEDNIKRIEEIMQLVIEVINNSDIR